MEEKELFKPTEDAVELAVIGRDAMALIMVWRGISPLALRLFLRSPRNWAGMGERHCFAFAIVESIAL